MLPENRLRAIFETVCGGKFESRLVEMEIEGDECRLVIDYPAKWSVSALIDSLKGVSSRLLRDESAEIRRHCVKGKLWSPSYEARSVYPGEPQAFAELCER